MERITKAAKAIETACGGADVGLILGSGLGDSFASLSVQGLLSYKDIPGFPLPTVPGHHGQWVSGTLHGKRVAVMRGRFHYYEGYSIQDIALPVRVMRQLGVKTLIVTNAAGGVNTGFTPGDLMLIRDTINFSGVNPLMGPNLDVYGPRFPDMSNQFDPGLLGAARVCAKGLGIKLQEGVYMWFSGPSFETPAEIRMARAMGADAVGMSTVPEVLAARHCGMAVLGISCITNMAAGILDQPLNHQEVLDTGRRVRESFTSLIDGIVKAI